jgi:hypothetical protein
MQMMWFSSLSLSLNNFQQLLQLLAVALLCSAEFALTEDIWS